WFSASQCSLRVRATAWATPASAACEILIFKAFASESRSSGSDTFVARLGALRGRLTVSMTLSLFNSANMRTFHNTLYVHTSQAGGYFYLTVLQSFSLEVWYTPLLHCQQAACKPLKIMRIFHNAGKNPSIRDAPPRNTSCPESTRLGAAFCSL